MNKKFYVTTPIYYVNAQPHLGHTYTTIAADVLARYHRMVGDPVFFLTGTDEHGAKIAQKAEEEGKAPQQFVDEVAAKFRLAWEELSITHDRFIRTTEPEHKAAVGRALEYLYETGAIYKDKYEGLYCQGCEQFKNEKDLVDGLCPDHKVAPQWMSEEAYMFKQSQYQAELLERIKSDDFKIRPLERKNEMISFLEQNELKDVAFSRQRVSWGIPLPWEPEQTAYVWADALLNYLTGLGWAGAAGEAPEFWPASVQLLGKDILRIHATIWPAMLLALKLPLPRELFVHGFFLSDGQKMSKSLGNVIAPEDLVKKYGVDGTRYLLMGATTFGHDGDITWKFLDEKYNADLANGLGNLVSRVVTMALNGYEGRVPAPDEPEAAYGALIDEVNYQLSIYRNSMDNILISNELLGMMKIVGLLDKSITELAPWKALKEGRADDLAMRNAFYVWLESLRLVAWMAWPFMPAVAEKIWQSLGLANEISRPWSERAVFGRLEPGTAIAKPEALFPRVQV